MASALDGHAVAEPTSLVFGPVPSRRLGRSLGVNTIPHKVCSYSCAYCQVGRTAHYEVERRMFHDPGAVFAAVRDRLEHLRAGGGRVDYLGIVPDGEPTLDLGLGRCIGLLKTLGLPVAVITNASLLARADVRADLATADWVSVKVDAVRERTWRRLDHPDRRLALPDILGGISTLRAAFRGRLVTETMLVEGANDGEEDADALAAFLARLAPSTAYLAVPTRPPADPRARPASAQALTRAYQLVAALGQRVELLTGGEGDAFATTGDAVADLLSITAVHPMRRSAVEALLARAGAGWRVVDDLVADGRLAVTAWADDTWFLRSFTATRRRARTGRAGG
jgi:wyosine [tRNA(Phe)-imidazoG37] synthetase (radical SAM superfamily)